MKHDQKKQQCGASMTDYCLLIALIAVTAVLATHKLGSGVSGKFDTLGRAMYGQQAGSGENPIPNPGGAPPGP